MTLPQDAGRSDRRLFLKRVLRAGAYIPPALAVLSLKNVAVAQASAPAGNNPNNNNPNNNNPNNNNPNNNNPNNNNPNNN